MLVVHLRLGSALRTKDLPSQMRFWIPIRQNGMNNKTGEYIWTREFSSENEITTKLPWAFGQPNGLELQQCVAFTFSWGMADYFCDTAQFCSLCELRGLVRFHLLGLPETSLIDRDYIFVPQTQDVKGLVFTGYKKFQISWIYSREQWQISDRSDLSQSVAYSNISQSNYVLSKRQWSVYVDKEAPINVAGMPLKLSKVDLIPVSEMNHA